MSTHSAQAYSGCKGLKSEPNSHWPKGADILVKMERQSRNKQAGFQVAVSPLRDNKAGSRS